MSREPVWEIKNFFNTLMGKGNPDLYRTQKLQEQVQRAYAKSNWPEAMYHMTGMIFKSLEVSERLHDLFHDLAHDMNEAEHVWYPPEFELTQFTPLKEQIDIRYTLRQKMRFLERENAHVSRYAATMEILLQEIAARVHIVETKEQRNFQIFVAPMIHTTREPYFMITNIIQSIFNAVGDGVEPFEKVRAQLTANLCSVSGIEPGQDTTKKLKWPEDTKLPLVDAVKRYLGGTPFEKLLLRRVPLGVNLETRYGHMHVLGGSGAGKTQLMQSLILQDLLHETHPSIIVIDGHGDLINTLSRLERLGFRRGTPVFISPRNPEYVPAINPFDLYREEPSSTPIPYEQFMAGVLQTFDYLFTGLVGADLTAKQHVFFRFLARLMLTLKKVTGRNATILDMLRVLEDPSLYWPAIQKLDTIPKEFFERDFMQKTFNQTKEQIRYRLNGILENPTLAAMLTTDRSKIDFSSLMNVGACVLIDTAKDYLKGASSAFGKIFITHILQCALERAAIPREKRRPVFIYIDEAADYFDQNIDDLLTEVRKYNVGLIFAHQYLDQASPSLRASFMSNTNIKMVSSVSANDARAMAPEMRTTPEFIMSQPKLTFATYIRGVTPHALSTTVTPGEAEHARKATDLDIKWWWEGSYEYYYEKRTKSEPQPERAPEPKKPSATKSTTPDVIYLPPPDDIKPGKDW